MKSINFYILTILVFLISTAQSEDNPDLNLASSGGAVIIQDGGSEVDKFLKSKGWKKTKEIQSQMEIIFMCLWEQVRFQLIETVQ